MVPWWIYRAIPDQATSETIEGKRCAYARPSIQKNLFATYVPCSTQDVAPSAASIGGVNLRRTALPFVTLGTSNAADTAYHSMIADFSEAAHPGIFDPNFGWIELRQGHCMLDLEKVLFDLWEHYTDTESIWNNAVAAKNFNSTYPFEEGFPEFGRKGTRYLNFKELRRACFIACQVQVQSSLAASTPAFEHKSAFGLRPSATPESSQHSTSFSSIPPPLKRKFSGDDTDK